MAGTSPTSRSFGVTCGFFYVKEPLLTGSGRARAAIRMSTSNIVGLSRDCAIPHACRERCFGLPLYSAIAREALAGKLGLLHFVPLSARVHTKANRNFRRGYIIPLRNLVFSDRQGSH